MPNTFIFQNAVVLEPGTAELIPEQSIVVEGDRIVDVGPRLRGPTDAVVFDVAGKTVVPGLIDAHTHPAIVDTLSRG